MKNRRGFTLVELIASIALISIVMVFLFQLLIELRYNSLNNSSKVEYKVAATILTKTIQDILIAEEVSTIGACDATNTCLKINFISDNYLEIRISNDNQVLNIIKKDSADNVLEQDVRQIPEKDETGYLGSYSNLSCTTSAITPENPSYDYRYDSLLKLSFIIYDSLNNEYPVAIYYPYTGGGDFSSASYNLTVLLDGGTWDGTSPQMIVSEETITINNPTKDGYVFDGWTLTGEGSLIVGTAFTMGTEVATLTASWLAYDSMFTYTGSSTLTDDGSGNFRIKFLTSGTFTPLINMTIDVFIVGGGGGGRNGISNLNQGGGGAGGLTGTWGSITLSNGVSYTITIGAGGSSNGGIGGTSSVSGPGITTMSKAGGAPNSSGFKYGGNGGSGGGTKASGNGGSDGSDGYGTAGYVGAGQGTTTREFGEVGGTLYAGAGGGGGFMCTVGGIGGAGGGGNGGGSNYSGSTYVNGVAGMANTGGGGGGGGSSTTDGGTGAAGGSGIVIIRNS